MIQPNGSFWTMIIGYFFIDLHSFWSKNGHFYDTIILKKSNKENRYFSMILIWNDNILVGEQVYLDGTLSYLIFGPKQSMSKCCIVILSGVFVFFWCIFSWLLDDSMQQHSCYGRKTDLNVFLWHANNQ